MWEANPFADRTFSRGIRRKDSPPTLDGDYFNRLLTPNVQRNVERREAYEVRCCRFELGPSTLGRSMQAARIHQPNKEPPLEPARAGAQSLEEPVIGGARLSGRSRGGGHPRNRGTTSHRPIPASLSASPAALADTDRTGRCTARRSASIAWDRSGPH